MTSQGYCSENPVCASLPCLLLSLTTLVPSSKCVIYVVAYAVLHGLSSPGRRPLNDNSYSKYKQESQQYGEHENTTVRLRFKVTALAVLLSLGEMNFHRGSSDPRKSLILRAQINCYWASLWGDFSLSPWGKRELQQKRGWQWEGQTRNCTRKQATLRKHPGPRWRA